MKVVKSENNLSNINIVIPEKQEKQEKQEFTIKKEETIESLMNELLPKVEKVEDENHITFEITLTKRQKESYDAKGGLSWLKKCIDRNVSVKKTNKRKK